MSITPSPQQTEAIRAIADWYHHGKKPYFYLAGYAGSGKTSLIPHIIDECELDIDDVKFAAYTGKAAMVMTRKGLLASTVHSLIYRLDENKLGELVFGLDKNSTLRSAPLLVLDECSMISDEVALDLLSFRVKILVLGDPGQLEPVSGTGYFTKGKPDFFLSEIHRQALENPIIRVSMDVRNDKPIPMGDYGGVLKIPFSDLGDEDLLAADQVLTGANATRWGLNQLMMKADGFDVGYPMLPGVKTICLRNNKHHGLFNGMIGRTTATVDASMIDMAQRYFVQGIVVDEGVGTEFEFEPHRWHMGPFQDNWDPRSDEQKLADQQLIDDIRMSGEPGFDDPNTQYHFDLAYAVTTHKCVDPTVLIPIFGKGMQQIGNVRVGDITPFGAIRGVYPTQQIPVKMVTSHGYEIVCSKNHRWVTADGLLETQELIPGTTRIKLAQIQSYPEGASIDIDYAWWLGALVGDGSYGPASRKDGTIHFACKKDDVDAVEVGNKYQQFMHSRGYTCNWRSDGKGLHSSSRSFREQLLEHGLDYVTGTHKKIPSIVWEGGHSVWSHFLGGLFDADGSVRKSGFVYTTVSPQLSTEIQQMLLFLGIYSKKTRHPTGGVAENRWYYNVHITADSCRSFLQIVKFVHPAKRRRAETLKPNRIINKKDGYDVVISVTEMGPDTVPMIDVEIDSPHILSFGSFMGHNSQGSQWGSVLLVDDGFVNWKPESRRRWLYTALTRAVDIFVWAV